MEGEVGGRYGDAERLEIWGRVCGCVDVSMCWFKW